MSTTVAVVILAALATLAYAAYRLLEAVTTLTGEVTRVIGRVTSNDPVQNVDDEGVIRQGTTAELLQAVLDAEYPYATGTNPSDGPAYVDPTDLDLPDPAEYDASNRVIMGDDPTWPKFDE